MNSIKIKNKCDLFDKTKKMCYYNGINKNIKKKGGRKNEKIVDNITAFISQFKLWS